MIFPRLNIPQRGAILVFSLGPDAVEAIRAHRRDKSASVSQPFRFPLPAAAFKDEPVQTGIALLRHLHEAGVSSRQCIVCIPLNWSFSAIVDFPSLSESDLEGFMTFEAERRFPLPPHELTLRLLRPRTEESGQRALLLGVPSHYLSNVEAALRAARLQPKAITFAVSALAEEHAGTACAVLRADPGIVDLAVVDHCGALALRNVIWSESASDPPTVAEAHEIARQLRITLSSLAPAQRDEIKTVVAHGGRDWPSEFQDALAHAFAAQGLMTNRGTVSPEIIGADVSPALLATAMRHGRGEPCAVNLMSRRKGRLQSYARWSSRNFRRAAAALALIAVLVAAGYWRQGRRLAELEKAWAAIGPRVESVKMLQDRVRLYRSWYDEAIPSLSIAHGLASAFPEEGSVWVKSLSIKDGAIATCSGSARSRSEWMQVMEKLGKDGALDDLQVVQTRGDAPLGFTLTFHWKGKDASGS